MRVLCLNCGSSSLKFDLLELTAASKEPLRRAHGSVQRIGKSANLSFAGSGHEETYELEAPDHGAALAHSLAVLRKYALLEAMDVVAHRVVHGGPHLTQPVVVDTDVLQAIDEATELAPLHNGPALATIRAAREQLGPELPMTASFDTSFFAGLPDVAREYALPADLRSRLGIRRYGFHGLAHRYMAERYALLQPGARRARLVTLQLGNGSSAAAILGGRPIDTSMGFTPLEGLIMGTRSGDIDPALPMLIAQREGLSVDEVEALLNHRSGLLGLSGRSNDMAELLAAASEGDENADLAIRAYCYRVSKYVGAYAAALGGLDGIVFGGGIGENSTSIRQAVCERLAWLGLCIDSVANQAPGPDRLISAAESQVAAYVAEVNEASVMAADAFSCLAKQV